MATVLVVDDEPIVREVVVRFLAREGHRTLELTARFAPDTVERVLLNLLTNALRHTPSAGSVAVRVEPSPGEVRVAVEDTGDGLAPGAQERMFERFRRADRSRSSQGTGLGLAISRGLVEAHGGRIWAEDREEGGARVCFTLPAS